MEMAIELNRDNFEQVTLESDKPLLIDFWGPQCGPCLALNPFIEKVEEEYRDKITVAKVNAAENRMLCAKLRVLGLPTFLLYKDGAEQRRITGNEVTEKNIIAAVQSTLT
jgi:thioredoxin 1